MTSEKQAKNLNQDLEYKAAKETEVREAHKHTSNAVSKGTVFSRD
jgi:hypothetical protein